MATQVDICDNCGSELEGESHFAVGKTWCPRCWRGREPPTPQPVSEAGKAAIARWIAPRPAQQSLNLGELAQRQGGHCG